MREVYIFRASPKWWKRKGRPKNQPDEWNHWTMSMRGKKKVTHHTYTHYSISPIFFSDCMWVCVSSISWPQKEDFWKVLLILLPAPLQSGLTAAGASPQTCLASTVKVEKVQSFEMSKNKATDSENDSSYV